MDDRSRHLARRPLLAVVAAATLALAGCSDGADDDLTTPPSTPTSTTAAPDDSGLHPDVRDFLDQAAGATRTPFTATYRVLQKLGSKETTVTVTQAPPSALIEIGDDLVVVTGPDAATCSRSEELCIDGVREDRVSGAGLLSGSAFYGDSPAATLRTVAGRADAGEPVSSEREVAGVQLRCISVPVDSIVAHEYCITPEGVFGYVDNPAVRLELTTYSAEPPVEETDAPYPRTDDPSFLFEIL